MLIYRTVDKDMAENDKTLVSSPRKKGLNRYCHSHFKQNRIVLLMPTQGKLAVRRTGDCFPLLL